MALPNEAQQSGYSKGVEFLKQLNVNKFILNDETDIQSNGKHSTSDSKKSVGYLTKIYNFNIKRIPRYTDIITAFYIPENCNRACLYISVGGVNSLSKYESKGDKDLNTILNESQSVPHEVPIERILDSSLNFEESCYYQQNSIIIDGHVYKRVVLCYPVIPLSAIGFHEVTVEIDADIFYMEHIIIYDNDIVSQHQNQQWPCVISSGEIITLGNQRYHYPRCVAVSMASGIYTL